MKDLDAIKARLYAAQTVDVYGDNGEANLYHAEDATVVWLGDDGSEPNAIIEVNAANRSELAVFIQHAYNGDMSRLIARVERLEAALEFYGNRQSYEIRTLGDGKFEDILELPPAIKNDGGETARTALAEERDQT